MSKAILATIPNCEQPDTALELAVEYQADNKPVVTLRHLSWNNGLGWYPQQPFHLTPDEAAALLHSLRTTRHLWQERDQKSAGKVIPFPVLQEETRRKQEQQGQRGRRQKKTGDPIKGSPVRELLSSEENR